MSPVQTRRAATEGPDSATNPTTKDVEAGDDAEKQITFDVDDGENQSPTRSLSIQSPPASPARIPIPDKAQEFLMQMGEMMTERLGAALADGLARAASKTPDIDSNTGRDGFKPRAPDHFSGKDRSKLPDFLAQCRIYFHSLPKKFPDDRSKIMFVGSYLDSPAFDWFCNGFLKDDPDDLKAHFIFWSDFVQELENNFGDPDAQHRAERELQKLHILENHRALRYITEFERLSGMLPDWSDRPLAEAFYRGLPDRIKTNISNLAIPRPRELHRLKRLVTTLDENYWDMKGDAPSTNPSNSNSSNNKSKKPNSSSRTEPNSTAPQSNSTSSTDPKAKSPTSYSRHLGSDGKLTQAEKDRRKAKGLCAYCGEKHLLDACPLRKAPTSASTNPAATSTSGTPNTPSSKARATITVSGPDSAATITEFSSSDSEQGND